MGSWAGGACGAARPNHPKNLYIYAMKTGLVLALTELCQKIFSFLRCDKEVLSQK